MQIEVYYLVSKEMNKNIFILNDTDSFVDLSSIFSWNHFLPIIETSWFLGMVSLADHNFFGKNAHFTLNGMSCG